MRTENLTPLSRPEKEKLIQLGAKQADGSISQSEKDMFIDILSRNQVVDQVIKERYQNQETAYETFKYVYSIVGLSLSLGDKQRRTGDYFTQKPEIESKTVKLRFRKVSDLDNVIMAKEIVSKHSKASILRYVAFWLKDVVSGFKRKFASRYLVAFLLFCLFSTLVAVSIIFLIGSAGTIIQITDYGLSILFMTASIALTFFILIAFGYLAYTSRVGNIDFSKGWGKADRSEMEDDSSKKTSA